MKIYILSITFILCFFNNALSKTFPLEIITNEVKYYNASFKEVKKKIAKAEKKANKEDKRNKANDKFLGGTKIEFDFEGCLKNRRTKAENDFIEKLSAEEKIKFKEKVKKEIKKKYPKVDNGYY